MPYMFVKYMFGILFNCGIVVLYYLTVNVTCSVKFTPS